MDPTTPTYAAGWNLPGYLPEEEPQYFHDLADAYAYLRDEVARWLDEDEAPEEMTAESILQRGADYIEGWYPDLCGGSNVLHIWAEPIS